MTSTRLAGFAGCAASILLLLPAAAGAATITPNITTDEFDLAPDATCSLREAIQSANTNAPFGGCPTGDAGTDTITLTASNMGPSYRIIVGSANDETNAAGDFDVTAGGPLLIRGTASQEIDTIAPDRIFDVKAGAALTLENLIVADGDATTVTPDELRGGNIRANMASGSLTLNDVIVRFGQAEAGGGIYAADGAQLNIIDSRVENNNASEVGGGVLGLGGPGALSVDITRSEVQNNFASSSTDNSGLVRGGGISFAGQQLTITDSEITENQADHTGNMAGDGATGGGISTGSNTTIRRSLIAENTAIATNGSEEKGGGILAEGGGPTDVVNVVNSTLDDNQVGNLGDGEGGAVFTKDDADAGADVDVSLAHVTFTTGNQTAGVTTGDQVQTATDTDAGTITLRASILPGFAGLANNPCAGPNVVSAGFNIAQQDDPDCNFGPADSTSTAATGANAAPPVDNGGLTPTIALQLGGRAANFVPAAECGPAEGQDQRAYPRPLPVGGACDAGAYELHSCDGANILNGPFVACPVPASTQTPPAATPAPTPTKCKKKKKKKRKRAAPAATCKKKKKKKRR